MDSCMYSAKGHGLQPCHRYRYWEGFSPGMSKPDRPQSPYLGRPRCFFITASCAQGRAVLQSARMAELFMDTLHSYVRQQRFIIHDFVVMPNHVHALITVPADTSLETAMQLIKGGFSFRAKKELGFTGEIWQRGFSDVYVADRESFLTHREYIDQNPVRSGLVSTPQDYPFGSAYLKSAKAKADAQLAPARHE